MRPGTQSRRFTHIQDSIDTVYYAWKKNNANIMLLLIKKAGL